MVCQARLSSAAAHMPSPLAKLLLRGLEQLRGFTHGLTHGRDATAASPAASALGCVSTAQARVALWGMACAAGCVGTAHTARSPPLVPAPLGHGCCELQA